MQVVREGHTLSPEDRVKELRQAQFDALLGPPNDGSITHTDFSKQFESLRNDVKWPPEEVKIAGPRGVLSLGLVRFYWGQFVEDFGRKLMIMIRKTVDF